jgi:hypothetical protein
MVGFHGRPTKGGLAGKKDSTMEADDGNSLLLGPVISVSMKLTVYFMWKES